MEMSDRELLELAAKAAGWRTAGFVTSDLAPGVLLAVMVDTGNKILGPWNPLEDDGDALRLAVLLDLFSGAKMFHFRSLERFKKPEASEIERTRRAIVLTAAEIGKAMQEQAK